MNIVASLRCASGVGYPRDEAVHDGLRPLSSCDRSLPIGTLVRTRHGLLAALQQFSFGGRYFVCVNVSG